MKSETIKAIFTNVLFVIGVILVIFGFSRGLLTGVNLVIFDKYPLNIYEESRCDNMAYAPREIKQDESDEPSAEELEAQKQECLDSLDYQRKIKLTEDIVSSITTLVSGGFLIYFFRKFILR